MGPQKRGKRGERAKIIRTSLLAECHLLDARLKRRREERGFHVNPHLHTAGTLT